MPAGMMTTTVLFHYDNNILGSHLRASHSSIVVYWFHLILTSIYPWISLTHTGWMTSRRPRQWITHTHTFQLRLSTDYSLSRLLPKRNLRDLSWVRLKTFAHCTVRSQPLSYTFRLVWFRFTAPGIIFLLWGSLADHYTTQCVLLKL